MTAGFLKRTSRVSKMHFKYWPLGTHNLVDAGAVASRLRDFQAPTPVVYSYVIGLSLIYTLVMVHIPIAVFPVFPHDDGLYMRLGQLLAEGKWLGPYNQFTLMKGPGYPAFLALNNWLRLSISLSHALFHCFSISVFVIICQRFIKSHIFSALLLLLLLWHPISLSGWMLRVFREEIYYGQTLLVLGTMLWVLFCPFGTKRRNLHAAVAGAVLGWFWLTREEGIWIIPALVLLVLAAASRILRGRWSALRHPVDVVSDPRFRDLAVALAIVAGVFVTSQVAFRSINWFVYGKFIGVDFKETNFQRALGAIHSVRTGGIKPFVSITKVARRSVNEVSPAFASLSGFFDGPGKGWEAHGCGMIPSTCGEIASGWFMWALRDAAAWAGHYASPQAASQFFGRLADEISAACTSGKLECNRQLISDMPPIEWPDVFRRLLPRYVDAFHLLILANPPLNLNISAGTEKVLAPALRFLNYPLHTRPAENPSVEIYSISGWYYKPKAAWISAEITTPSGGKASSHFERLGSPDIQQGSHDPDASNQRFMLETRCNDSCIVQLRTPEGETTRKTLGELRKTPIDFKIGTGHLHIDSTDYQSDPEYTLSPLDRLCGRIRDAAMTYYSWLFLPILAIGFVSFLLANLLYWRKALWNVCFVMALLGWGLTFERTSLLLLIDSSSFPAFTPFYLGPAYFMLVCGAVFSIVSLLQLSSPGSQSLQNRTARPGG